MGAVVGQYAISSSRASGPQRQGLQPAATQVGVRLCRRRHAFAAPTILNGTLFVGSAGGAVQALDAKTGCLHWLYQATGPVRAAMTVATDGARHTLVFSDQNGWVYALDAAREESWKKRVEEHEATRLTGSVAVQDGVAFVPAASWEETRSIDPGYPCCTFRGSVTALRVRDGSLVWKTYLVDPPTKTGATAVGTDTFGPSGAGVWSTPTIDQGTRRSLHHDRRQLLPSRDRDQRRRPRARPQDRPDRVVAADDARRCLQLVVRHARRRIVRRTPVPTTTSAPRRCWCVHRTGATFSWRDRNPASSTRSIRQTKERCCGRPASGKARTNGGVQWGMASDGRNVYVSVSDVVRPPGGISGPAPIGDAQLDPMQGGGLTALSIADGTKVWFAASTPCDPPRPGCSPAQPGAVTVMPGAVFSGSMDGHIRAFSTADGKLLWDFDTEKTYRTVNGVPAKGGSLDGAGPVVVAGMMFVNSGYPRFGGAPGNVLLAFGVREQP